MISRLREAFEVELPLRALFEAPTVAALARRGRGGTPRRQPQPIGDPARGSTPPLPALSFAQERLWFLDQLEPGNPFYVVPLALRLRGPLDVDGAGARHCADIVRRHEVLRTTFPAVDGRPVQAIGEAAGVALPVEDLRDLPPDARAAEAERLTLEEARRPFDLARGPLLRARMLRVADDEHILLLTMHHIVADGWSLGVLVRRARAALPGASRPAPRRRCRRCRSSMPTSPPGSATGCATRCWRPSSATGAASFTARRRCSTCRPTGRARPRSRTGAAASASACRRRWRTGCSRLSRRDGATLFMTLLAGFAALLHRYSGQDDLVIGSPIANRNRVEIEPLIGFFVNTLVLRIDLRGDPTSRRCCGASGARRSTPTRIRTCRSSGWSTNCSPSATSASIRCSR